MAILPKLRVEKVRTSDLVPYARNAKEHSEEQVAQIAASIEQFGFNDPIGVWTRPDGQLEIVEGHGRVMAAKLLGVEEVPIIRLDHLDDDGRRAYTHVHNQTTLTSGLDVQVLDAELAELACFDWGDFGFPSVNMDGFGIDFSLDDSDGPRYKTMTLQMTAEQYGEIVYVLDGVSSEECEIKGGNEYGDKVCEVVRRWGRLQR